MQWDIFCRVIDNFGDIGVCWRLSADLAARGHRVRLWVDDASALQWMAPGALQGNWTSVTVHDWGMLHETANLQPLASADVWVEGFGCDIPDTFVGHFAGANRQPDGEQPVVWINLEYLSAQAYVERSHALPSPVMSGPAKGWTKQFFYPGFTRATGGLPREPGLAEQRSQWSPQAASEWLAARGVVWTGERLISLFCYEPQALAALLRQLQADDHPTLLLVTAGRATAACQTELPSTVGKPVPEQRVGNLCVHYLAPMTQSDYDRLLWSCDLNFVRGEDSVVRALWAGKPFIWHIYPQEDGAHADKLDAFLTMMDAPGSLREVHYRWNGLQPQPDGPGAEVLPLQDLPDWARAVRLTRQRLLEMEDLASQLIGFSSKKR